MIFNDVQKKKFIRMYTEFLTQRTVKKNNDPMNLIFENEEFNIKNYRETINRDLVFKNQLEKIMNENSDDNNSCESCSG